MALGKWPVRAEWAGWIEGWCTALRAAGRSPATVGSRRQVLAQLSREVSGGPGDLSTADLLEWMGLEVWDEDLGRLRARWSSERRRTVRSALAGFYGWAHGSGRVEVDPSLGLPRVRPADGLPRPAPLEHYLQALDRAEERDRLALVLACELGMRRAEVAVVHTRDVVEDLAGCSLVVHGKGGRQRLLPLSGTIAAALVARGPGWVFPGRVDGHVSPRWLGRRVAQLLGGETTMHQLRHLFATEALRSGSSIVIVQRSLGHRSLATTQRYLAVDDEEMRQAVTAVHARLNRTRAPTKH